VIREIGLAFLDIVYPRVCGGCGGAAMQSGGHWCWDCRRKIELIADRYCSRCGDPIFGEADHPFVCRTCGSGEPRFDLARSAARYSGPLKNAIQEFKYRAGLHLLRDLADLATAAVRVHYVRKPIDVVTCVPLRASRLRERGYNQSQLLAERVGRDLRLPVWPEALVRVRKTEPQAGLAAAQRRLNVAGAFGPGRPSWIKGRNFLLVDDVMTTGATVNECAKVLKQAAACRVYVVTVARG